MKIVDNRTVKTKRFDELKAGELFYFPEEDWYGIVLYNLTENRDNAVDIQTGELAYLYSGDQVVLLQAQLVIE